MVLRRWQAHRPGGGRVGAGDHRDVAEAAAIGVPHPMKGQTVVCFCVLQPGQEADESLASDLKALVARQLGKPLQPREVRFLPDLPKKQNAKVMRRVGRTAYLEDGPGDLSALVNPESVRTLHRQAP